MDSTVGKEIREICLRLLTRREHSYKELIEKLAVKGFGRFESQAIVDVLAEQGWQSDLRFAESYTRYRIKKGFGPIKISFELQQRGIENFDLDPTLLDVADDWDEVIESVYLKKYSDDKLLVKKEWLKRSRFLQQRGFSSERISVFFKRFNIQLNYS
ncbi:MAG: recombination regulator RecX [Methylococcaceae bacterium]|nr:recombination regulator RecX [Methylococcaceae bacterium]